MRALIQGWFLAPGKLVTIEAIGNEAPHLSRGKSPDGVSTLRSD
jgi:hypothetical protein